MVVVIVVLAALVVIELLMIRGLVDRLLVKAGVKPLDPIIETAPEKPEKVETRKKLFSLRVDE